MVVACRTQRLLHSSKIVNFSRTIQLPKNCRAFGFRNVFDKTSVPFTNQQRSLRLCSCRFFHSSKEPRSSLAKLSPLEVSFRSV